MTECEISVLIFHGRPWTYLEAYLLFLSSDKYFGNFLTFCMYSDISRTKTVNMTYNPGKIIMDKRQNLPESSIS